MFQNMSIRVKLLISYLCVTLIPIIVFGMIMTSWLRENTMEKSDSGGSRQLCPCGRADSITAFYG